MLPCALQWASKSVVVFRKTFFASRVLISLVSCCQTLVPFTSHSTNHLFFQGNNQLWRIFAAESPLARAKCNACLCKCKPYPFLGLCHLTVEGDNFAHPPLPYILFRFYFSYLICRVREFWLIFIPVATSQSNYLRLCTSLYKVQLSMQKNNLSYLPWQKRKYFPRSRRIDQPIVLSLTKSLPYPPTHLTHFQPPKHPPSLLSQEKERPPTTLNSGHSQAWRIWTKTSILNPGLSQQLLEPVVTTLL